MRDIFKKMALFIVSTAFTFALLEVSIRLFYKRPQYTELIHVRSEDPVLLYEMKPHGRTILNNVTIETNSLGYRDNEPPLDLYHNKKKRVLVLGDSIAFGWGVEMRNAFPQRLEKFLNESPDDGEGVVVFNFGVSGYNTRQEIRALKLKGLSLNPDLVLVAYCLNDPDPFTGDHVRYFHPPRFETCYYLGRAIDKLFMRWSGLEYHHYLHWRYRSEIQANFRELARLGRQHGFPVALVLIPVFDWTDKNYLYQDIHTFLRNEAKHSGLLFIDLWPAFEDFSPRNIAIDVWHPNGAGHEIIAKQLVTFVTSVVYQRH